MYNKSYIASKHKKVVLLTQTLHLKLKVIYIFLFYVI